MAYLVCLQDHSASSVTSPQLFCARLFQNMKEALAILVLLNVSSPATGPPSTVISNYLHIIRKLLWVVKLLQVWRLDQILMGVKKKQPWCAQHQGEKPYGCEISSKFLCQTGTLQQCLMVHSGVQLILSNWFISFSYFLLLWKKKYLKSWWGVQLYVLYKLG